MGEGATGPCAGTAGATSHLPEPGPRAASANLLRWPTFQNLLGAPSPRGLAAAAVDSGDPESVCAHHAPSGARIGISHHFYAQNSLPVAFSPTV